MRVLRMLCTQVHALHALITTVCDPQHLCTFLGGLKAPDLGSQRHRVEDELKE